ncbi:AAA family ATPase [Microbacterium sp.]|uniref:AAA family ATPase n=1 Tax=Microbacterium sp. TaxID=51671 RepID=UPI0039E5F323
MEILRLAGPPGVGKSTVAWTLAQHAAETGIPVAYLDIDQLGMCYPAADDDPDRWRLKERALRRLARKFAAAGAERLIVSGVASPDAPPPASEFPTWSLWLNAPETVLGARLATRGWTSERVAEVASIGASESSRADPSWTRLETGERAPHQTVADVLRALDASPPLHAAAPFFTPESADQHRSDSGPFRVLWLCGPRVAGTSSVGWAVATEAWSKEYRTGFIDAAQLSFVWNIDRPVGACHAQELAHVFRDAGAQSVVIVAPLLVDPRAVRQTLASDGFGWVRIRADEDARRERIRHRRQGRGPVLPGDDLVAAPESVLESVLAEGSTQLGMPLRDGEALLDTSCLTVLEAASRVQAVAES